MYLKLEMLLTENQKGRIELPASFVGRMFFLWIGCRKERLSMWRETMEERMVISKIHGKQVKILVHS